MVRQVDEALRRLYLRCGTSEATTERSELLLLCTLFIGPTIEDDLFDRASEINESQVQSGVKQRKGVLAVALVSDHAVGT